LPPADDIPNPSINQHRICAIFDKYLTNTRQYDNIHIVDKEEASEIDISIKDVEVLNDFEEWEWKK
jgi:hypothetical protein